MKRRGRHPEKALNAIRVKALSQPGRYTDGNALYLVVDPTGAKRWVSRVVVQGRRRDIGLGSAQLVSLLEAREKAYEVRKLARAGGDPLSAKRKATRLLPTFEEAARRVHAEHAGGWKNAKHRDQWLNTLRDYAFPAIGSRRVDQIETPDILKILSPIWLTKPETARRVRQRTKSVLDWAKAAGHRSGDNPVDGVGKGLPKQTDRQQHYTALQYAEVPGFVLDLKESGVGMAGRLAFELLILTATRTSEVLDARAGEFDLERKVWTIPAARMKGGREHRIPLSSRAVEIVALAMELSADSEFVFASASPTKPLSNMVFLMALRRMGRQVTAHGFRSAFRDWAAERTSFPREVCEAALAHATKDRVEAAYRRSDLFDKRRRLMDAWAGYVCGATSNIIALPRAVGSEP